MSPVGSLNNTKLTFPRLSLAASPVNSLNDKMIFPNNFMSRVDSLRATLI